MKRFIVHFCIASLALVMFLGGLFIFVPRSASAAAVGAPLSRSIFQSFGGHITAIYPFCLNGGIWITIFPAGAFQPFYIWTPTTITKSYGPPHNVGQEVLGVADIPYTCVVSYVPPVLLFGQRMLSVGTSRQ